MAKGDVTPLDKQIGSNVARIRNARCLSRAQLGDCLSTPISHQAVDKYEKGVTRIPASSLVEFARLLRCTVADLFDGCNELLGGVGEILTIDRRDENLLRDYHQLDNPELQAAMRNMVRAMVIELATKYTRIMPHE